MSATPQKTPRPCAVGGCDRQAAPTYSLCYGHRMRHIRHGDVQADKPLRQYRRKPVPDGRLNGGE